MSEHNGIVEKDVSSRLGLPIEDIKSMSPTMIRSHIEKMKKERMSFASAFPVIGRGSVLRDFASTEELNAEIDTILKND